MGNIASNPYLFFDGNCREAMEFYKGIFGGTVALQTYDQAPGDMAETMKGKIMHASLEGEVPLMASDRHDPEALGTGKISLSLGGTDEDKLRKYFEGLSSGGEVHSPLKKEFWGDTYGSLTDKFGISWMVNIAPKPAS